MKEITRKNLKFRLEEISGKNDDDYLMRAIPEDTADRFSREGRPDADPDGLIMGEGNTEKEAVREIESYINMLYDDNIDIYNKTVTVEDIGNVAVLSSSESDNIRVINKIYEQLSNKGFGVTYITDHQSNVYEALNYTLQHRHTDTVVFNQNQLGVGVNLLKPINDNLDDAEIEEHAEIIYKFIHKNAEFSIGNVDGNEINNEDTVFVNLDNAEFYNSIKDAIGVDEPLEELYDNSEIMKKFVDNNPETVNMLFRGDTEISKDDVGEYFNMFIGREEPVKNMGVVQEFLILSLLNADYYDNHTLIVQGLPDVVLRSNYSNKLIESDLNLIFSADTRFDSGKVSDMDVETVVEL